MPPIERNWDILLIGGASGSGKTRIAYPLARLYGIDLVRVDDFQVMLEAITTPASLPPIHYWNTHPDWQNEGVKATVNQLIDVGQVLTPGLTAVINDHIEEKIPMILEGDFVLPKLAKSVTHPMVKSIFIYEPSKDQILKNFLQREGTLQQYRADVSHFYGNWLADRCAAYGIAIIESRPWDSLLERALDLLQSH